MIFNEPLHKREFKHFCEMAVIGFVGWLHPWNLLGGGLYILLRECIIDPLMNYKKDTGWPEYRWGPLVEEALTFGQKTALDIIVRVVSLGVGYIIWQIIFGEAIE
ncbi:hypothetical protein LCGC14_1861750 [marine sediment metagenome]|uniref:Uncharacterized protein n=1 Tax=marine sediment metagenome TaxID=412755 RepID=A0A0F9GVQ1_9ZZZZ